MRTRRKTRASGKLEKNKKDTPEKEWDPMNNRVGPEGCQGMSVAALGALALDWLSELDDIRIKAGMKKGSGVEEKGKGLQGRMSGQMKAKIIELKDIVRSLTSRALVSGDIPFLRNKKEELRIQLKEKEEKSKEKERKIQGMERTLREVRERKEEEEEVNRESYEENIRERNKIRRKIYLRDEESREDVEESEVVLRPSIGGKRTAISAPVKFLKKKEEINREKAKRKAEVNLQIKALVELRKNIRR